MISINGKSIFFDTFLWTFFVELLSMYQHRLFLSLLTFLISIHLFNTEITPNVYNSTTNLICNWSLFIALTTDNSSLLTCITSIDSTFDCVTSLEWLDTTGSFWKCFFLVDWLFWISFLSLGEMSLMLIFDLKHFLMNMFSNVIFLLHSSVYVFILVLINFRSANKWK